MSYLTKPIRGHNTLQNQKNEMRNYILHTEKRACLSTIKMLSILAAFSWHNVPSINIVVIK